jgi:hypothetical protein
MEEDVAGRCIQATLDVNPAKEDFVVRARKEESKAEMEVDGVLESWSKKSEK